MARATSVTNEEILVQQDPDLLFLLDARPLVTPDQVGVQYGQPSLNEDLLKTWSQTSTAELMKAHGLKKEEDLKRWKEREKQMEETRNKLQWAVEHPEKPSDNPER